MLKCLSVQTWCIIENKILIILNEYKIWEYVQDMFICI